jgi:predicted  nucleic acid-binding Zn-ribbon protein
MDQLVTNHKEVKPVSIPVTPKVHQDVVESVQASCIKCGQMRDIKNPKHVVLKNMRHTIQGICPWCGSKLSKFVKAREQSPRDRRRSKHAGKKL